MRKKLNLRRPIAEDIERIEEIAKQSNHPLVRKFDQAVIAENGRVIAFGVNRTICESIFYGSGSKKERGEALREMIKVAVIDAKRYGFDDIYTFAENEQFAEIMIKHFAFRRIKSIPLILDL